MPKIYKDIIPLTNWEDKLYIKPDLEAVELVKIKKYRSRAELS
jgi:aminoglycoside phosphotransferase family enzyme